MYINLAKIDAENIIHDLEAGLEHAQEVLAAHDTNYGRTTKANKTHAESIEEDIANIRASIDRMQKLIKQ